MKKFLTLLTILTLAPAAASAYTAFNKPPDIGPFWNPLSPTGTYVYSDGFIARPGETFPSALGTWLVNRDSGGDAPAATITGQPAAGDAPEGGPNGVRFEIWAEAPGGGPDPAAVLATTGTVSPQTTDSLTFFQYPLISSTNLVPGTRYYFVATCVGESGSQAWRVGGHTPDSVYPDGGRFWYSNDPAGIAFDGQNFTPEMAFTVFFGESPLVIPTLGRVGLWLLAALVGFAALRALRAA